MKYSEFWKDLDIEVKGIVRSKINYRLSLYWIQILSIFLYLFNKR